MTSTSNNQTITLSGDWGDDEIFGSEQKENLYGGEGEDTLIGGAGNDRLDGGFGDDVLEGGAGNDEIYGGAATDQGQQSYWDEAQQKNIYYDANKGSDTARFSGNAADYSINRAVDEQYGYVYYIKDERDGSP